MGETDADPSGPRELSELAAAMREEWRVAQETEGRDAAEQFMHGRALRDVALEWLHRGDDLTVEVAGVRVSGAVTDVGDDLVALRTASGRVDVHVHPAVPILLRPSRRKAGGTRRSAGPRTFRATLLARESTEVVVGTTVSDERLRGRLVVARDHVRVVTDGGIDVHVPISSVAYVRPAPEG